MSISWSHEGWNRVFGHYGPNSASTPGRSPGNSGVPERRSGPAAGGFADATEVTEALVNSLDGVLGTHTATRMPTATRIVRRGTDFRSAQRSTRSRPDISVIPSPPALDDTRRAGRRTATDRGNGTMDHCHFMAEPQLPGGPSPCSSGWTRRTGGSRSGEGELRAPKCVAAAVQGDVSRKHPLIPRARDSSEGVTGAVYEDGGLSRTGGKGTSVPGPKHEFSLVLAAITLRGGWNRVAYN